MYGDVCCECAREYICKKHVVVTDAVLCRSRVDCRATISIARISREASRRESRSAISCPSSHGAVVCLVLLQPLSWIVLYLFLELFYALCYSLCWCALLRSIRFVKFLSHGIGADSWDAGALVWDIVSTAVRSLCGGHRRGVIIIVERHTRSQGNFDMYIEMQTLNGLNERAPSVSKKPTIVRRASRHRAKSTCQLWCEPKISRLRFFHQIDSAFKSGFKSIV